MTQHCYRIVLCLTVVIQSMAAAENPPLSVELEKGIFAEETEGDAPKAIEIYEGVIAEASPNRPVVAEAMYRLGLCYLKQSEEHAALAEEQFRNLTQHYSDVSEFSEKANAHLHRRAPYTVSSGRGRSSGGFGMGGLGGGGLVQATPGYGAGSGRGFGGMGMGGGFVQATPGSAVDQGFGFNPDGLPSMNTFSPEFVENQSVEFFFDRIEEMPCFRALEAKGKSGPEAVRHEILQRASERILGSTYSVKTRWMSCYALSGSTIEEGIPVLEKALKEDPDETVRGVAACALGAFPLSDVESILKGALEGESNQGVKDWIRKALSGDFQAQQSDNKTFGHRGSREPIATPSTSSLKNE